jgi:hypothetical protein
VTKQKLIFQRFEEHVEIKQKKDMVQFLVFIKVIPNLDKGFLGLYKAHIK